MLRITLFMVCVLIQAFCFNIPQVRSQESTAPAKEVSGEINTADINIRADANTNSDVICTMSKNDTVTIIAEKYDWYKIRLPKKAYVYVKKDLFTNINDKTAIAAKDKINIRFAANETSMILGRISKDEVVNVKADKNGWLQIEPTIETYGWVNKKLVNKIIPEPIQIKIDTQTTLVTPGVDQAIETQVVIEGKIQPYGKVIKRQASHKLITKDNAIYLLKGNKHNLNSLLRRLVKITGKQIPSRKKQKYPTIEVEKMEALD